MLFLLQKISRFYEGAIVPLGYLRDPNAFQKYKEYKLSRRNTNLFIIRNTFNEFHTISNSCNIFLYSFSTENDKKS